MANNKTYDVIVVGAGPAGYVAAIRCAQLGMKTACVDNWVNSDGQSKLGGTCLNVGCIPSKALLESSELYEQSQKDFGDHGINVGTTNLDVPTMIARKDRVVDELTSGIEKLFEANGVEYIAGSGKLLTKKRVRVKTVEKKTLTLSAEHIILAAGSSSVEIAAAPLKGDRIVDSTGALSFDSVPERLGIIGAGVIGLELGSVWRRLGAKVTLLEAQEQFLSMADQAIARDALRLFAKQGLDVRLGARVTSTKANKDTVAVSYEDSDGEHTLDCDKLIVAVGRRPNTEGLFEPETQLLLDEWGYVHVDKHCQTNVPGVYAVGDVVRGPMLAHKGSEEGVMVADRIAGQATEVNYALMPSVIYTLPELAWVGKTEQDLKKDGINYKTGRFPFAANGRARALGDTDGQIKILADATTDRILGVHMLGRHCSELVAQAVIAMEFAASSEDLALTIFAHPSLSESVHEAALDVNGHAIHISRPKK
ncbi:MAG: dihydrolipoyl dehydrogenase [Proteobacteria bacterium]|nr:dihydrolipoyl dehydrogenase [Pseudomonadota bacterium]